MAVLLPWESGLGNWLRVLPLHLGFVSVILAAGLAILRYRLYDLDIVVSRAILVATATAFVAAGYVLLVVGIGRLLPTPVRGSFWPSLLATAVVALAFQPLRLWAVRLADRIAYGPRAVPYEALASFARMVTPGGITIFTRPSGSPRSAMVKTAEGGSCESRSSGCSRQVDRLWPCPGRSSTAVTCRAPVSQAAVNRSGPNADLVTYAAAPHSATKSAPASSS